ncbi:(deoxy)nucleoside triphosphate pyrophosphohydrolase [Enterococcus mediterraneensis]|uniref:(deoxy)nucleoside triphosphate pyrophosphohydrolase n=1 Tax=Enterococcus mediterraneensis TaxID=2364791 RepID=UPI000F045683|nr:(deoxy)nucleoside triphosphate pyrophosphohydrolase [Enterococcus mediterraneensis]
MGKKDIFVVGAILVQDGEILCCQRGPGRALANLWEFPGGKIETGEKPVEALQRELSEELKIQVDIIEPEFVTTAYEYDFGIVHLTTFICHLKKGKPELTEHIQLKWLKPTQLSELEWAPADLPTVDKLITEGVGND